jgi:hypothetical protein
VTSLTLALVTGLLTLPVGLNSIGGGIALFYAVAGLFLIASRLSVTFEARQQQLYFSSHHGPFERRTRTIPFAEIDSVYLDYEEHLYPHIGQEGQVERKWFIFLVLHNRQTVTLASYKAIYSTNQAPNRAKQTASWEMLARKICEITGALLIRTPTVPGYAPRTFVEVIDQLIQRRLAGLPSTDPLTKHTIRLRSHPNGSLEFIVDGVTHRELSHIQDEAVRRLIQAGVDEWQTLQRRAGPATSIKSTD